MDANFPGPFCKQYRISRKNIEIEDLQPLDFVPNGLVLELHKYCNDNNLQLQGLVKILSRINKDFTNVNPVSLNSKVLRVAEQKKKLVSKKKVKGIKNLQELLNKQFDPPVNKLAISEEIRQPCFEVKQQTCNDQDAVEGMMIEILDKIDNSLCLSVEQNISKTKSVSTQTTREHSKETNLLVYDCLKLMREVKRLDTVLEQKREAEEKLCAKIGHYSVRNVNKRDQTARENLHKLRDLQRKVQKQEKNQKSQSDKYKEICEIVNALRERLKLCEADLECTSEKLKLESVKKISLQKSNSYLKQEIKSLRQQLHDRNRNDTEFQLYEKKCVEQELKITDLETRLKETVCEMEHVHEVLPKKIASGVLVKNDDGSYSNNIRVCVMELASLEVAVEKIAPVIQAVSANLFEMDIHKNELPSSSTVQKFIDEGHYVVKTFLAEKLNDCENWGLNRDGTTRKRQKIVDTSVTLNTGDVVSLGFDRVHKENAVTINKITQRQIQELGDLHSNFSDENAQTFVANSLEKLAFTMSDRASNEKLANKLLSEWRDEVLKDFKGDKLIVHQFHCMAHTLLGFHAYSTPEVKAIQKDLVNRVGQVGRDALPYFKTWSQKESFAERASRCTSDIFGPAGDHRGVREKWESYCAVQGVKSLIGKYKDNRFNGIFETSAEVFVHRNDFLHVLEMTENKNMKIKAVEADLKSTEVCAFLQAYGLYFLQVTGPFWNLVTGGEVSYLDLSPIVLKLRDYLQQCANSPSYLLEESWLCSDPTAYSVKNRKTYEQSLFVVKDEIKDLLHSIISCIANGMIKCVNKQLSDFLENGLYFKEQHKREHIRTDFAMVTNLACEHHFGDLDSSQRRRPNASMHHHSSIQLLKRNKGQVFGWLGTMTPDKKSSLLQKARKGGVELRQKHLENEKSVFSEINTEMLKTKDKKRKRIGNKPDSKKKKGEKNGYQDNSVDLSDEEIVYEEPHVFINQQYVAVAYQDDWYPGVVQEIKDNENAVVKFMAPCRKNGHFQWPLRDDVQLVNNKFVLSSNFVPDCLNSGRQYEIKNSDDIELKFQQFRKMFFC